MRINTVLHFFKVSKTDDEVFDAKVYVFFSGHTVDSRR